jgi:hypothetical protein
MDNKGKLTALYTFWVRFHSTPTIARKHCPFTGIYDKTSCNDLCYSFSELVTDDFRCPCHKWGAKGAFDKLEKLLIRNGYKLHTMEDALKIRTIVPCKECHEHPCTCKE